MIGITRSMMAVRIADCFLPVVLLNHDLKWQPRHNTVALAQVLHRFIHRIYVPKFGAYERSLYVVIALVFGKTFQQLFDTVQGAR